MLVLQTTFYAQFIRISIIYIHTTFEIPVYQLALSNCKLYEDFHTAATTKVQMGSYGIMYLLDLVKNQLNMKQENTHM
jgi:hypothetical protein